MNGNSKVLFLCTGNYYRSRFAEILFNHLATGRSLAWEAFSRGLAIELLEPGAGPISPHTVAGLAARGISLRGLIRQPVALREADFLRARHIVALKQQEHRPMLRRYFPGWAERVEYWDVHDVDFAGPDEALPQIEAAVLELIERLVE